MPEDELNKEPGYLSPLYRPITEEQYLSMFSEVNGQRYIGDASTAYLTDPESANTIHAFCPHAKIVMVLRNPVERAYSLYNWMAAEGYEYASSFKRALALEKSRKQKRIPNPWEPQYFWNYMYFSSGLYAKQVARYLEQFPQNNILILRFDDLKADFRRTYEQVCDFLDITPENIEIRVANKSSGFIHPLLQFALRKIQTRFGRFCRVARTKTERDQWLRFGLKHSDPPQISSDLYASLAQAYDDDIAQLCELTSIDFGIWRQNVA